MDNIEDARQPLELDPKDTGYEDLTSEDRALLYEDINAKPEQADKPPAEIVSQPEETGVLVSAEPPVAVESSALEPEASLLPEPSVVAPTGEPVEIISPQVEQLAPTAPSPEIHDYESIIHEAISRLWAEQGARITALFMSEARRFSQIDSVIDTVANDLPQEVVGNRDVFRRLARDELRRRAQEAMQAPVEGAADGKAEAVTKPDVPVASDRETVERGEREAALKAVEESIDILKK